MIVFEHLILQVLARLETDAERLCQEVHRKGKRHDEIELVLAAIERELSRFEKLSPPIKTDRIAAIHRHIGWVRRGIREGSNAWIEGNSDDIKDNDVRLLKEKIGTYFQHCEFLPLEMRAEIAPLLDSGEYDSAVRKAFLVVKQKAIDKYEMPKNLDGEDMVNFLFSESGKVKVHDDEKKRKAFRDLASGFFRFFRNEYMHGLGADEQASAQCALSILMFLLQKVEEE